MSSIIEILRKSFILLREQPKLFVPKIISTLSASLFLVYLLSSPAKISEMAPGSALVFLLGSLLGLSVLGVFSSMMLSSMVRSSDTSLYISFFDVLEKGSNVLKASFATIGFGLVLSSVFTAGYWAFAITGNPVYLVLSFVIFVVSILAVSYLGYFLPVTLLLENNFTSAFGSSMKKSGENRRFVTVLLIFSVALIGVAFFSAGFLETLGYIGFVVGRLISSIANTYIFTVSPTYYFEGSGS